MEGGGSVLAEEDETVLVDPDERDPGEEGKGGEGGGVTTRAVIAW